jgi:acyl carrier protein
MSPKFGEISRNLGEGEGADEPEVDLQRLLAELPEDVLLTTIGDMLKVEIGKILRIAPDKIDANRSVQQMGLDSLMGVELVVAVESRFGVRLPVMALSDSPTVAKLAAWIVGQLQGEESANDGETQAAATRAQIARVAGQHAETLPAAEVERIAENLRIGEAASSRRMIQ